jgi:hypothetical protein
LAGARSFFRGAKTALVVARYRRRRAEGTAEQREHNAGSFCFKPATNKKPRHSLEPGVLVEDGLAVTYFGFHVTEAYVAVTYFSSGRLT